MEEYNLLLTILSQAHLVKKITNEFSISDHINICKAIKPYNILSKTMPRYDTVNYTTNISFEFCIELANHVTVMKIKSHEMGTDVINNLMNYGTIHYKISPCLGNLKQTEMEKIGEEISNVLKAKPFFNQLVLSFNSGLFYVHLSEFLIKNINSNDITTIFIRYNAKNENVSNLLDRKVKFFARKDVYKGFQNLKTIKLDIHNIFTNDNYKKIIGAIQKAKGVTLEIKLDNIMKNYRPINDYIKEENFLLTYILKKKIFLKISGTVFEGPLLSTWLSTLKTSDLFYITYLRFEVRTISAMRRFAKFLPYMVNLEFLAVVLKLKDYVLQTEKSFFININGTEKYEYDSFSHLKKLKVLQVFVENPFDSENMNEKLVSYKDFCHEEVFSFLSSGPKEVEHLYLSGLYKFTSSVCTTLNNFFPNVTLLYLESITNPEANCLEFFKKLRLFICRFIGFVEIPQNVESVLLCDILYNNLKKTGQRNLESYSQFKSLEQFSKEIEVKEFFEGTIFYSYYDSISVILNHINEIKDAVDLFSSSYYEVL